MQTEKPCGIWKDYIAIKTSKYDNKTIQTAIGDHLPVKGFVYDMDDVYCVWQNTLKENDIVDIDLDFFEEDNRAYYRSEQHFSERAYSHEQLSEMLEKAGFKVEAVYGDMTFEKPQESEQRVIYIARKI